MNNELTDPYGHLIYAIGTENDFWCFDYHQFETGEFLIHAVVNCETGCFIETGYMETVSREDAIKTAIWVEDIAVEWLEELEHDFMGWNQDTTFFSRQVQAEVEGVRHGAARHLTPPSQDDWRRYYRDN